jgi:hypothetical protein
MSASPDESPPLAELEERRRQVREAEEELAELEGRQPPPPTREAPPHATTSGYRAVDRAEMDARDLRELDTRLASLRIDVSIERSKRAVHKPRSWRGRVIGVAAVTTPSIVLFGLFRNPSLAMAGALLGGLGVLIWRILEAGDSDPKGGPPPTSGTMNMSP